MRDGGCRGAGRAGRTVQGKGFGVTCCTAAGELMGRIRAATSAHAASSGSSSASASATSLGDPPRKALRGGIQRSILTDFSGTVGDSHEMLTITSTNVHRMPPRRAFCGCVAPQATYMYRQVFQVPYILHFESSIDASSSRSDVISLMGGLGWYSSATR